MFDEIMLQESMEGKTGRNEGEVGRVIFTGDITCNQLNQGGCIVIGSL